jgi:hypothetical protein
VTLALLLVPVPTETPAKPPPNAVPAPKTLTCSSLFLFGLLRRRGRSQRHHGDGDRQHPSQALTLCVRRSARRHQAFARRIRAPLHRNGRSVVVHDRSDVQSTCQAGAHRSRAASTASRTAIGIDAGRPLRGASSSDGARGDAATRLRHFRTVLSEHLGSRAIA